MMVYLKKKQKQSYSVYSGSYQIFPDSHTIIHYHEQLAKNIPKSPLIRRFQFNKSYTKLGLQPKELKDPLFWKKVE
jgi:hypothetical protein